MGISTKEKSATFWITCTHGGVTTMSHPNGMLTTMAMRYATADVLAAAASHLSCRASIPSGFSTFGRALSVIGPGATVINTEQMINVIAEAHASGLQRGDGSFPSGNSRRRNVPINPTPGTHRNPVSAATISGRGRDPGWVIA